MKKDKSRKRGVSVIHRSGPRWALSMQKYPLPEPDKNADEGRKSIYKWHSKDHGLWGFFNSKRDSIERPDEHAAHGRAWTYAELSKKSWDDLHKLWWVCAKDRNRIATSENERRRVRAGFGEWEAQDRDKTVRETQKQIKQVLQDRWIAWNEAQALWDAGKRPDLDEYMEEEAVEEEPSFAQEQPAAQQQSSNTTTQTIPPPDSSASRPTAQA